MAWQNAIYPAYMAAAEVLETSRIVRKEVQPNGGFSMRDDLKKLVVRVSEMDVVLSRCVGSVDLQIELSNVPQFRTDRHGYVTFVNKAFITLTGRDLHDLEGRSGMNIVAPIDRQRIYEAWQTAVAQERHFEEEYLCVGEDGSLFNVQARAIAQRNSADEFIGHNGRLQVRH